MAEYEVKFLVRGMVSVFVQAETAEQAHVAAEHRWEKKSVFRQGLNVIDEKLEVAGVDNMDKWRMLDD